MKMKLKQPIIELKMDYSMDKFSRVGSVDETRSVIKEYQNYGLTKFYISNKSVDAQDEVFVHLFDGADEKQPRFTIYILDTPQTVPKSQLNGVFAAFVVPIGKESEYHFVSKRGRQDLVSQAKFQRLALVYLNRAHKYESLDSILGELSPKIKELAPKSLPENYKIPMLSMGQDLYARDVKYKGTGDMCGEFYVEDLSLKDQADEDITRRLVFQSTIGTIQTEVILKPESEGSQVLKPNYNMFTENYFAVIVSQFYALKFKEDRDLNILIVGLGGGALAMYCKTWLPNCSIEAVEIDKELADCATNWFGLGSDVRVHIADGLEFVRNAAKANKKWDIVIVDVSGNDPEADLWVPTPAFVEEDYLRACREILAEQNGMFVLNMICWKDSVRKMIYDRLGALWKKIFLNTLDTNEVLFCLNNSRADEVFSKNPYLGKARNASADGKTMRLLQEISSELKELSISNK